MFYLYCKTMKTRIRQLTEQEIEENNLKPNPIIYTKGKTLYAETIYGSFVDVDEYGMVQQKNALSEKELKKYEYVKN